MLQSKPIHKTGKGKGEKKMSNYCHHCGASVNEEDRFCTVCGKPLSVGESAAEEQRTAEQTKEEKKEHQNKQELHLDKEPITLGGYMFMFLILCIPIVNLVVLLLWAFGKNGNVNRRNFSRAALIYLAIGIVLSIGVVVFFASIIANVLRYQGVPHHYEPYRSPYIEDWGDFDSYDEYLPDSTDDFMFSITEQNALPDDLELYDITISGV